MFIQDVWKMIKDPYQSSPVRILIEILLLGIVLRYAFNRKKSSNDVILSPEEAEQLIDEWEPKELGMSEGINVPDKCKDPKYILSTFNPFLFSSTVKVPEDNPLPIETAQQKKEKLKVLSDIIEEYGVGTCGPRGFYGTIDIHLELEKMLAESLGVEGAVLYAHSLLAIASVIKCFCKRDDVILYDHRSSISIRRGIYSSKAKAISYSSTSDLNLKLAMEGSLKNKKFIITEGVFEETGETADIAAIVKARSHHKAFLILDESVSLPMLGSTGAVGFFGANPLQVDLRIGSLSTGFGSAGGFCVGSKEASDLQRLSSLAYCFSASLPAYLSQAALLNMTSVIEWEESQIGFVTQSVSESSSEESQYTPAIDYPAKKTIKSPKFVSNVLREKNSLINQDAAKRFQSEFNRLSKTIPFRAKTDQFTPIARIILQDDHPDPSTVFSEIHTGLINEGIYARLSEYPNPSVLFVFHNAFQLSDVSSLAKTVYTIITEAYTNALSSYQDTV
ncbi:serine palmitoyltransferase [Nematocida parisii]|nr:serine palmitoyltransferase [Nematocida parisii]KAI5126960.1 serine palmitoyltransferase [Nematocida parisii]KAI5141070.1 serine palmitoyltransferase [Nematocida parisii]KAI5143410.1 serine palmitoyltransferase [Nematocida parisii]KAI5154909.1 serine palmitoyltransferase [Nematocida parisii]